MSYAGNKYLSGCQSYSCYLDSYFFNIQASPDVIKKTMDRPLAGHEKNFFYYFGVHMKVWNFSPQPVSLSISDTEYERDTA